MKAIKYITILVTSLFVFNSCTKQVAGPAGPAGSTGAQGPSASYSVTIDSVVVGNNNPWPTNPNGNNYYTYTFNNIKALTTPNQCVVDVYVSTTNNLLSTWYPLPAPNVLTSGDYFDYYYGLYTVTVEYTPSQPAQTLYFKIIVINLNES